MTTQEVIMLIDAIGTTAEVINNLMQSNSGLNVQLNEKLRIQDTIRQMVELRLKLSEEELAKEEENDYCLGEHTLFFQNSKLEYFALLCMRQIF